MIYSYKNCIEDLGTDYRLKMAVAEGKLFRLEKGIYADKNRVSELELIMFKYPKAILTLDSAFYYHGLTDVIPDQYVMNTDRNAPKIKDPKIKQCFCSSKLLEIGKIQMVYQSVTLSIYDLERSIIELIRYRDKLPFDYYKEIIHTLRNRIYDIDIEKLQSYIPLFPAKKRIQSIVEKEIV